MDSTGVITDWNPQAEATFGWSRDEALGRDLAETIIPERHREAHQRGLQRFLATGEGPRPRPAGRADGAAPRRARVPGRADDLRHPRPRAAMRSTPSCATSPSASASSRSWPSRATRRWRRRAEVGVPGHDEPRDPHPDERRDRDDRPAARHRARRRAARVRRDGAHVGRGAARRSSTTSSTSPRSRPAGSSWRRSTSTCARSSRRSPSCWPSAAHDKGLELVVADAARRCPPRCAATPAGSARC